MRAIVAGAGHLPEILAARLQGAPHRLCALEGFVPEGWAALDVDVFRIEQIGSLLNRLVEAGVTQVCFAGVIRRPEMDPTKVDAASAPLLGRLVAAAGQGDDGALRAVAALFEERGMQVIGAQDIAPDLLPQAGCLTQAEPTEAQRADAARAEEIVEALGRADVGQACVVAKGQALTVEGLGGTDWMLRSIDPAGRARAPWMPQGGLLFKAPKPTQDRRFDMPTVGPTTIALAHSAGLEGIVIKAEGVFLIDPQASIAAANDAGLFLWVRP
ncbi:UDP-2,3-diacylglucosamine diphosphatase LpxI [Alphaproteobacteria bacterium KMM 3653]|uniref:UDP-2,3-diacylglucosamine diphosphatase LpxI n=1 Tax=Harenicola maris TaxID=2841044 RepID=A0AAP2G7T0_9RHOB|nr:UDP-2,3-diacylglucosamine diphosphatase LpxI [Harenicola maris]MBT0956819.1 UDP-2,3-diacylglucosamine diphosphatase LpxI [Harenicola maris]